MTNRKEIVAMTFPEGAKVQRLFDGKVGVIKSVRGVWINFNFNSDSPSSIQCYPIWQAIEYMRHYGTA